MHETVQRSAVTLAKTGVPVLLVRGLKSDVVSDAGVAAFRELVPHLEVADVSGAGHMVAGDRNDAFNDAAIAFLEQHLPLAIPKRLTARCAAASWQSCHIFNRRSD
jgi:pimeloyl-ACP methyl ester carboxylesterase